MKKKIKTMLLLIGLASCREEEILLPKSTTEGLNTFGCKVNGKIWLPRQGLGIPSPQSVSSFYNSSLRRFDLIGVQGGNEESIRLYVENISKVGKYNLVVSDKLFPDLYLTTYDGNYVDDQYVLFSGATNELNITRLDTIQKIISGNFQVELKGIKNRKIVKLTEGIFDIKYDK
jgi:hypothetical protein